MSASPDIEHENAPDAMPLRTVPDARRAEHSRSVASALAPCLAVLGAMSIASRTRSSASGSRAAA